MNNSTKEVKNTIIQGIKTNKFKRFKKSTNVLIDLVKNKNNFFKWQTICSNLKDKSTNELINLATLQGIQTNNKSKRHICKDLAVAYETQMLTTSECHNETSILGDPIELIPKPLLMTFKDNGKEYCFNIIELIEMINKGDKQNPYTRNKLPVNEIKDKMLVLREILIEDKLSLVNILDEIKNNQIMTKENILRLQI